MAAGEMKITMNRVGPLAFEAVSGQGHVVRMDGPPAIGGEDSGVRPMEMVLMGLAGCSGVDVVMILEKQRQKPAAVQVTVTARRADATPAVFTEIELHFAVSGEVDLEKLQRAADLSFDKYCSVSRMLQPGVKITHTVALLQTPR